MMGWRKGRKVLPSSRGRCKPDQREAETTLRPCRWKVLTLLLLGDLGRFAGVETGIPCLDSHFRNKGLLMGYGEGAFRWGLLQKSMQMGGFQKESACPKTLRVQSKSFLWGKPHCGMFPWEKRNNHFLICNSTYLILGGQEHFWGNWAAFKDIGSLWSMASSDNGSEGGLGRETGMSLPAACDFFLCAFSWPPAEFLMWNRRFSQVSTQRLAGVCWGLCDQGICSWGEAKGEWGLKGESTHCFTPSNYLAQSKTSIDLVFIEWKDEYIDCSVIILEK